MDTTPPDHSQVSPQNSATAGQSEMGHITGQLPDNTMALPLNYPGATQPPVQIDMPILTAVEPSEQQGELILKEAEEAKPLTSEQQLESFDREQLVQKNRGHNATEFSRRNRQILAARARKEPLPVEEIAEILSVPLPTVKWVLALSRKGLFSRLVVKHRAGRLGKRRQIIDALRRGVTPEEVKRQFKLHRTTILRACQQLKTHTRAA